MKKTLAGFAALLALSDTAFAADFADTLRYPNSPRFEAAAPRLDYSTTASIKTAGTEKQRAQTSEPMSSRQTSGDSAGSVVLPVGNTR